MTATVGAAACDAFGGGAFGYMAKRSSGAEMQMPATIMALEIQNSQRWRFGRICKNLIEFTCSELLAPDLSEDIFGPGIFGKAHVLRNLGEWSRLKQENGQCAGSQPL
jgi:hypothetical protein